MKNIQCPNCKSESMFVGTIPLRTKGQEGLSKLVLGVLSESEERIWKLDVFRCPNCHHIDIFDNYKENESIFNESKLPRCPKCSREFSESTQMCNYCKIKLG